MLWRFCSQFDLIPSTILVNVLQRVFLDLTICLWWVVRSKCLMYSHNFIKQKLNDVIYEIYPLISHTLDWCSLFKWLVATMIYWAYVGLVNGLTGPTKPMPNVAKALVLRRGLISMFSSLFGTLFFWQAIHHLKTHQHHHVILATISLDRWFVLLLFDVRNILL